MRKFFKACKFDTGLSAPVIPVRWSRPLESFNKVNFDATMFENLGYAGIEVAIRHSTREIIVALSQRIPLPHSVEMVEAMAARKTIVFVQKMSLSKVVVEGDCLQVVSALNASVCCNTLYGNVIEGTRRRCCQFQHCQFQHVQRRGNMLTHTLAKRVVSFANYNVWVEELPSNLEIVFQTFFFFLILIVLPFPQYIYIYIYLVPNI